MACTNLFKNSGVLQKNITMIDRKGVIYRGRENLNQWKSSHANDTKDRTLSDAIKDADVFLGLSAKGSQHKLTVFAPTDTAFHKLFASINHVGPVTVEVLRSNRELRQMVKALVVRGAIHSSQLS